MTPENKPNSNKIFNFHATEIQEAWRIVRDTARQSIIQDKLQEHQEIASKYGIDVHYKPVNGKTVVFKKETPVFPYAPQSETQEPTGQK